MNSILEDSNQYYKGLYQMMISNTKTVISLSKLVQDIQQAFNKFSTEIQQIAEHFHQEISKEQTDHDSLVYCYQIICNYILKESQTHKSVSKVIQSDIIEPFEQFISNFRQTNRTNSAKAKQLINNMEQQRKNQILSQDEYWKLTHTAEKHSELIEKTIQLVESGQKTQIDLQRVTDKSINLKLLAEEAENSYKQNIATTNKMWSQFSNDFEQIFDNYDINDQSRTAFTKQTIQKLVKILVSGNKSHSETDQIYLDKFKEVEEKFTQDAQPSLKCLSKGKTIKFKQQSQKEEFISYEMQKKMNDNIQQGLYDQSSSNVDDFVIIGQMLYDHDRKKIDQLLSNIMDQNTLTLFDKQKQEKHLQQSSSQEKLSQVSTDSDNSSHSSTSSLKTKQQQPNQKEKEQQSQSQFNELEYFNSVFQGQMARQYFMNNLAKNIQNNKIYHLQLNEEKFNEITEIVKSFINHEELNDEPDPEEFYHLLISCTRIIKKNQKNSKITKLSQNVKECKIWLEYYRWNNLFDHLFQKRLEDHKKKQEKFKEGNSQSNSSIAGGVKQGFKLLSKGVGFGLEKLKNIYDSSQQKQQTKKKKQDEEVKDKAEVNLQLAILEEFNVFLLGLELIPDFATDLVIQLASQRQIQVSFIQNLLEKQENQRNNEMRRSFNDYNSKHKKSVDEKQLAIQNNQQLKVLFVIKKVIQYLSSADRPWRLLLTSKLFYKELELKIYKIYLMNDRETYLLLANNRVKVWKALIKTNQLKIDYPLMKHPVIKNPPTTQVEEIIILDVNRSLQKHKHRINNEMLQSLLRVFAYYNKQISYCQGMNYIAGFLYLNFNDEIETYKAFHIIMNNYFNIEFFNNDFETLLLRFYQFERCLGIFLPELSDKFKQERVDSNYYATSWFITIFTSVFQYTLSSYVLICIWDIFLVEKWKGLFKCCMWILKYYQPKLMKMQFDEILHFLGDLIKDDLFILEEKELQEKGILKNTKDIKSQINQFKVTNKLLKELENERAHFNLQIKEKIQKIGNIQ